MMKSNKRQNGAAIIVLYLLGLLTAGSMIFAGCSQRQSDRFSWDWKDGVEQPWAGSHFWANRLQDWQITNGRLECLEYDKPMRTVHLLTHQLSDKVAPFEMSVNLGELDADSSSTANWGGFLVGAGEGQLDYRAAALVHHGGGPNGGIIAAVDGSGRLVFRDMGQSGYPLLKAGDEKGLNSLSDAKLELSGQNGDNNSGYNLTLRLRDNDTHETLSELHLQGVNTDRLRGNVALASHSGPTKTRYWFDHLEISGDKFEAHPDQTFGPFIGSQYTLSDGTLNLSAQMAPIQLEGNPTVYLDIRELASNNWKKLSEQSIDSLGWVAEFQVDDWKYDRKVPYRLRFSTGTGVDGIKEFERQGIIRPNTGWKDSVKIAALSCQTLTGNNPRGSIPGMERTWGGVDRKMVDWSHNYIWFPHLDMMDNLRNQKVDFYAFLGDQIYEGGSPTQPDRRGGLKSELDYLYKWYLWYWAFGDLLRDTPSITIPDDHDVFQGNLWGAGGRKAPGGVNSGGYTMSPEFVNVVQHTQTSHLPDPYDPRPVEQGISVYYTNYNLGGVSFAILEDRKFKSGPRTPTDEAELLGKRQKKFLRHWSSDWDQSWMKATLSQTIFGAVHTRGVNKSGEPAADKDTNGWPPAERDSALTILRKGYAFMIGGDQHLSTVVHHGVDDWNDAGYSFCVPAVSNFFPRWWLPEEPGNNREKGAPEYTGEFLDGFGNKITVYAAANPSETGHQPAALHDKAPGYGIITFNKASRAITMETWPRYAQSVQELYPGWPMTIKQQDNYGRKAVAYLPTLTLTEGSDPVVQVINESNGEMLYTIRVEGKSFRPKVFDASGIYTVKIALPRQQRSNKLSGLKTGTGKEMKVKLNPNGN